MEIKFVDQVDPRGTSEEIFSRVANPDVLRNSRYSSNFLYRPQLKWVMLTAKLKKLFVGVSVLVLVLVATHQVTASAFVS